MARAPAAKAKEKRVSMEIMLPEGQLINSSLFEKDVYVDERGNEGTPQYKIELTFDPALVEGDGNPIENVILDALEEAYGQEAVDAYLNGNCRGPFIDGDKQAKKREQNGKPGDAYKGKLVLRATTSFNHMGMDAPGGIQVFGPDTQRITIANADAIYPGCKGCALIDVSPYIDRDGDYAVKAYLKAFQKTEDGTPLVSAKDFAGAFKPVGRAAGTASAEGRRSRKG